MIEQYEEEAKERRDRSEKRVGDDVRYKVELAKSLSSWLVLLVRIQGKLRRLSQNNKQL